MKRVYEILMERDYMSKDEAKSRVQDVREMIHEALEEGRLDEIEDIIMSELGLEMDYIDELI